MTQKIKNSLVMILMLGMAVCFASCGQAKFMGFSNKSGTAENKSAVAEKSTGQPQAQNPDDRSQELSSATCHDIKTKGLKIFVRNSAVPNGIALPENPNYDSVLSVLGSNFVAVGDKIISVNGSALPDPKMTAGNFPANMQADLMLPATESAPSSIQAYGYRESLLVGKTLVASSNYDGLFLGAFDNDSGAINPSSRVMWKNAQSWRLFAQDKTVFVASGNGYSPFKTFYDLLMIDISQPSAPRLIGSYHRGDQDRTVSVAANASDVFLFACGATTKYVQLLKVDQSGFTTEKKRIKLADHDFDVNMGLVCGYGDFRMSLTSGKDVLAVPLDKDGIGLIKTIDGTHKIFSQPGCGPVTSLDIFGGYLVTNGGLIYSMADPIAPRLIGLLDLNPEFLVLSVRFSVDGKRIYAFAQKHGSPRQFSLFIYDFD